MLRQHPAIVKHAEPNEPDPQLSVIIPAYNEASNIEPLLDRLLPVLEDIGLPFELIFVDDGSSDGTAERVVDLSRRNPAIKLVRFSRNFGKEAALNAGLAHATGHAVIQMDGDLQHPPEALNEFVSEWYKGGEIVYGARRSRSSDGILRHLLTKSFYKVFSIISDVKLMEGLGDFLLLDRKVVDAILSLPERERFTKGLYAWVGFERIAVPFEVENRAFGRSKWGSLKLLHFAINAITSFGSIPLKVWSYIGLLMSITAVAYASIILVQWAIFENNVPGYPSLMMAICFFAGVQLLGLGIVGEYLSRIMTEVKQRPLYLVHEKVGFSTSASSVTSKQPADQVKRIAS